MTISLVAAPRAATFADTIPVLAIAMAVATVPVVAHIAGQPYAIALCVGIAMLVANFAVAAVPATLMCAFLFQNLAVAIVSPSIPDPAEFNAIRGYNFLTTGVMWLVLAAAYWTGPRDPDPTSRRLMVGTTIVLGLVGLYFVLGAVSDPRSAAIYLRNVSLPLFVFQACLIAAARSPGALIRTLPALGMLALAYGYAELLVRPQLFDLVNGNGYLGFSMRQQIESGVFLREMQETGRVIRGIDDMMKTDLFNSPYLAGLQIRIDRLQGPNFNPISFAYALATFSLVRLAAGRPLFLLAALPLLVVIGSKGAVIVVLVAAFAVLAFRTTRSRYVLGAVAALLVLYAGTAILVGLAGGDYHVVGLFGGINGFLKNPIGHGLGVGGNLSMDMTRIDWSKSQALGETDVAVESAVGVLLYQMGIAGFAVWLAPVAVAWLAWQRALRDNRIEFAAVAFGLLVVSTNGLLQEEALFAPLALASMMLFAGVAFGSASARSPALSDAPAARPAAIRRPDLASRRL